MNEQKIYKWIELDFNSAFIRFSEEKFNGLPFIIPVRAMSGQSPPPCAVKFRIHCRNSDPLVVFRTVVSVSLNSYLFLHKDKKKK